MNYDQASFRSTNLEDLDNISMWFRSDSFLSDLDLWVYSKNIYIFSVVCCVI